MRITDKMMVNTYQRNLNSQLSQIQRTSEQLYSKKAVTKASHDPYAYNRIMTYRSEIERKTQDLKNVEDLASGYEQADTSLVTLTDAMKRIRELATQATTGTSDADARQNAAIEIDKLIETMASALNTKGVEESYLFGGTSTNLPFEVTEDANGTPTVTYQGNTTKLQVEISKGVFVDKNVTGDVFDTQVNGRGFFDALTDLSNALKDNDDAIIQELSEDLSGHEQTLLTLRSKLGANQNRMEATAERYDSELLILTEQLSNIEDVDYATKLTEYELLHTTYQASMKMSAYLFTGSLMDYLN